MNVKGHNVDGQELKNSGRLHENSSTPLISLLNY